MPITDPDHDAPLADEHERETNRRIRARRRPYVPRKQTSPITSDEMIRVLGDPDDDPEDFLAWLEVTRGRDRY